jgi:hypothetical protein
MSTIDRRIGLLEQQVANIFDDLTYRAAYGWFVNNGNPTTLDEWKAAQMTLQQLEVSDPHKQALRARRIDAAEMKLEELAGTNVMICERGKLGEQTVVFIQHF